MLKHFAVWFCALTVSTAMLPGDAAAAETLVVALGSSSTAGKGVAPGETYPTQLETLLHTKGYRVRIINAGANGDTSEGMLSRLDTDIPTGTQIVILQTGTNDAGENGHNENIAEIIGRLRARSIRVVLFPTSMMRGLRANYAQADGHHLTPEGYRILAARLLPLVEREMHR